MRVLGEIPTTSARELGTITSQVNIPEPSFLEKVTGALKTIFPASSALGTELGKSLYGIGQLAKGDVKGALETGGEVDVKKAIGGGISSIALPASLGLSAPAGLAQAVGQYAGLGAGASAGESLAKGDDLKDVAEKTIKGGVIGGALGGVFNLLGKGLSYIGNKATPAVTEFTTGVPANAVREAMSSPEGAKLGRTRLNLTDIRNKSVDVLKNPETGLYRNLSDEFSSGLDEVATQYAPQIKESAGLLDEAGNITKGGTTLQNKAKSLLNNFRISTKNGIADFNKSSIVKGAEKTNIQDALDTVNNWTDYTPQGLQTLAERIGALRKFDTVSGTKNSAILGQIYNKVAGEKGLINTLYPELHKLRVNFATNKAVLDEINSVIGGEAKTPQAIQASVGRLDNMFRENKDTYIKIIRELSDRSGVDILGMIAGTDFQKVLPQYIRNFGGGGSIAIGTAGLGAYLNPWLLLLAPLFSPRAMGSAIENIPKATETVGKLVRAGTTEAISKTQ